MDKNQKTKYCVSGKTMLTRQISVDSIKPKYYNVETPPKAVVREKMIEILNLTKL